MGERERSLGKVREQINETGGNTSTLSSIPWSLPCPCLSLSLSLSLKIHYSIHIQVVHITLSTSLPIDPFVHSPLFSFPCQSTPSTQEKVTGRPLSLSLSGAANLMKMIWSLSESSLKMTKNECGRRKEW